jgi:hypothetical protein
MATAISMFAEKILNACCGNKADDTSTITSKLPFGGNKPTTGGNNTTAAAEDDEEIADEKKDGEVLDSQFKRKFMNQEMKFELTEWKKLPPKAKKACEELGYDETKWNNSEDVDCSWKHWEDLTESEMKALEIIGWESTAWESKYQWTEWNDLPKLQKKAVGSVGYTEDNWDGDGVDSLDKWWDDLEEKDRQAMCVLGWRKSTWDDNKVLHSYDVCNILK